MWRLIRFEFAYQRVILSAVAVCWAGLLLLITAAPAVLYLPEIPFLQRVNLLFWFLFYLAFVGVFNTALSPFGSAAKERRSRLHAQLPLSVSRLAVARVLVVLLIWGGLLVLFGISLWICGDWAAFWADLAWLRALLALTGAYFFGATLLMIRHDLKAMLADRKTSLEVPVTRLLFAAWTGVAVAYVLAVLTVIVLNMPESGASPGLRSLAHFLLRSWTGVSICFVSGAATLAASVASFRLRRSFLE